MQGSVVGLSMVTFDQVLRLGWVGLGWVRFRVSVKYRANATALKEFGC